jgi:parallel beta-helix repeat protein
MRRIKIVLVALVILIGAIIVTDVGFNTITMKGGADTLYVGAGPGNDSTTIQGAIDLAAPGGTVYVHSGDYYESADPLNAIKIDKTITLIGEDRDTTIINATGYTYGILISNADYVNITGFTVIGANAYNIRLYPSNDSHIYDNILKNSISNALGMNPGSGNLIEDNQFVDNPRGILISGDSSANILRNNIINSCSDRAVTIENGATENLLSSNTITNSGTGIHLYESENNYIEDNQISGGGYGIKIFDQSSSVLKNNVISDNDIGLKVFDYSSATILNCHFQDSDSYDLSMGDASDPKGDLILINTTFDYDFGVTILDDVSTLTVQWYLHIKVVDESDEPVAGIAVRIKGYGDFAENYVTNSEGKVSWIVLTNYIQDKEGTEIYTPYNVTSYNTTSLGYAKPEVIMSASQEVIVKIFSDIDGDGVLDKDDDFPIDPTQWTDSDGDGYGDNASGNDPDVFPNDPSEWKDSDGDEVGDNSDEFPHDPKEWEDSDGDGIGDNSDFLPSVHNTVFFFIVGIVVVVILIFLALMFSKRRKKPTKWGEEEKSG